MTVCIMNNLLASLSSTVTNRLRTPIIGAFLLSWFFWNGLEILLFLYSSSESKIAILSGSSTTLPIPSQTPYKDYFFAPAFLALVYTFVIPVIQHQVDKYKYLIIDERREKSKNSRDKDKFQRLAEVSEMRVRASDEFNRELSLRNLDNWEQQRENYEKDAENLRDQITNLNTQVSDLQSEQDRKTEVIDSTTNELNDIKSAYDELKVEYNDAKARLDSQHTYMGVRNIYHSLTNDERRAFNDAIFKELYENGDILDRFRNNSQLLEHLLRNNIFVENLTAAMRNSNSEDLKHMMSRLGYVYGGDSKTPHMLNISSSKTSNGALTENK